ncbi:MAG TPA: DMT family transporter [Cytophagales bacterium]|nr:DMT family transporter [Cytophagales bacterium]
MASLKDYLQLHFLIFLWGFTAIIGLLISIPAVEMVFCRTLLALLALGLLLIYKKASINLGAEKIRPLIFTGFIVAIHWITFFVSARISTASVCLAGFATSTFWTSLLEPVINKRSISIFEVVLGLLVLLGIVVIFRFEVDHALGLAVGILSALAQATFAILNGNFAKHTSPIVITFYEMLGAVICTALFFPFYVYFFTNGHLSLVPTGMDIIYIALLAIVCTVYAYTKAVELMKRISAFALNLSLNLEPVYGIIAAFLIFPGRERMSPGFYLGASIIIICVLMYPAVKYSKGMRKRTMFNKTGN